MTIKSPRGAVRTQPRRSGEGFGSKAQGPSLLALSKVGKVVVDVSPWKANDGSHKGQFNQQLNHQ